MIAKERIYVTADRKRVVPFGHKDAAFLLVAPGREISKTDVAEYGLVDGRIPKSQPKERDKPGDKEDEPGGNKQRTPGENKGGSSDPDSPDPPEGAEALDPATTGEQDPPAGEIPLQDPPRADLNPTGSGLRINRLKETK